MGSAAMFLNPAQAAQRLGVSAKALRLYEQRGLLSPTRSAAGWRAYGPDAMARGRDIVALRKLGLSLLQVEHVLKGAPDALAEALTMHQAHLEAQATAIADALGRVRALRADIVAGGQAPSASVVAGMLKSGAQPAVGFALPWPWGGEWFELDELSALTFLVGPLGSGKTRLAMRLAEELPDARFLGLDRAATPELTEDVRRALVWIVDEGGVAGEALLALLSAILVDGAGALVVDLVEQGLDQSTQMALVAWLRTRQPGCRALVLMTRSSAILDLAMMRADEAILYCPANHSAPIRVGPYPGSPGYEAVAMCLATPEVRARTEGVVAMRPAAVVP